MTKLFVYLPSKVKTGPVSQFIRSERASFSWFRRFIRYKRANLSGYIFWRCL